MIIKAFNFKNHKFTFALLLLAYISVNNSLVAQVYPLSDPTNSGGWVLNSNISDEFDTASLDEVKWQIQGKNGYYQSNFIGRSPSQFSINNALVENDKLKIRTKWEPSFPFTTDASGNQLGVYQGQPKPITTAAVISKQQFQYGYMEIKSKAADAEITSSFWTTGPGGPNGASELDMFEMFGGHKTNNSWKKRLKFNIISWDPNNSIKQAATAAGQAVGTTHTRNIQADNNTADNFHVYGFEWTADYIKVYIDGVLHPSGTITKSEITNNGAEPDRWVTDVPYWVWFDSETFPWLGLPDETDLATPVDYEIEYIRVWQTSQISVLATSDASEPNTSGEFKVSLPNGTVANQDITVSFTVGGTATQGVDYVSLSGTVIITNGSNSALIPVAVLNDNDIEGDETVEIKLTSASTGTVNTTPAEIKIIDTATMLSIGDIAIVGWKAEGNNNGAVAFMLLKDIVTGTKVSFSNRSWKGSQDGWNGDYSVDDVWTWTSGSSHNVGDIFKLDSDGNVKMVNGGIETLDGTTTHNLAGKISASDDDSDFDFSGSGDSILIYQVYGTFSEPTDPNSSSWITGINTNGIWGSGGGNAFCALPTILENGVNANNVGIDQDNGVYISELLGNVSLLRTKINDNTNWVTSDAENYNLWSYANNLAGTAGNIGSAGTLSVSNYHTENRIFIYPNPINTSISKSINISAKEVKHIIIYNISGVKVLEENKTNEPFQLSVDMLPSGLYFISFSSNLHIKTKKLIIK